MKKLVVVVALEGIALLALGLWWLCIRPQGARPPVGGLKLEAFMRDEDAPRVIQPSVGLDVDDGMTDEVFQGAPLWFAVGVNNAAAANEIAAAQAIGERLSRMPPNAPASQRLREDWTQRAAPAKITLGDAAHPWTAAVQLLARDAQGGEHPLDPPLPLLGAPAASVELDATSSARANFGTASAQMARGDYSLVACLGDSGSWHGRVCSEPRKLTVREMPVPPTAEQQDALDELKARYAFLAGDLQLLEDSGHRMLTAHPDSVDGHMYLGEARYRQGKWQDALTEFTTARAAFNRANPAAYEPPQFLNARINQVMQQIYGAP